MIKSQSRSFEQIQNTSHVYLFCQGTNSCSCFSCFNPLFLSLFHEQEISSMGNFGARDLSTHFWLHDFGNIFRYWRNHVFPPLTFHVFRRRCTLMHGYEYMFMLTPSILYYTYTYVCIYTLFCTYLPTQPINLNEAQV